jgi:hypothetical protein
MIGVDPRIDTATLTTRAHDEHTPNVSAARSGERSKPWSEHTRPLAKAQSTRATEAPDNCCEYCHRAASRIAGSEAARFVLPRGHRDLQQCGAVALLNAAGPAIAGGFRAWGE